MTLSFDPRKLAFEKSLCGSPPTTNLQAAASFDEIRLSIHHKDQHRFVSPRCNIMTGSNSLGPQLTTLASQLWNRAFIDSNSPDDVKTYFEETLVLNVRCPNSPLKSLPIILSVEDKLYALGGDLQKLFGVQSSIHTFDVLWQGHVCATTKLSEVNIREILWLMKKKGGRCLHDLLLMRISKEDPSASRAVLQHLASEALEETEQQEAERERHGGTTAEEAVRGWVDVILDFPDSIEYEFFE